MSTLSTTGDFVNTGLTTEKNDRLEENDVFQYPVSIATTAVNEFQLVSKELDNEVLAELSSAISQINAKKKEAIDLGMLALGPFTPGVIPPACSFYSDSGDLNNNISSGNETIEAVEGGGVGGGTTTPAVSYSIVRGDYVRIRRYPYLEGRTAPNDNALEGLKFPILNGGNVGQGQEDIYFENSKYDDSGVTYYVTDDEGTWSIEGFDGESGDTLGRFYQVNPTGIAATSFRIPGTVSVGLVFVPSSTYTGITSFFTGIQTGTWTRTSGVPQSYPVEWDTTSGVLSPQVPLAFGGFLSGSGVLDVNSAQACSSIASQQQAVLDEIDGLRVGFSTFFVSSNTTKQRKHIAQLKLWSAERVKTRNLEESQGTNSNPRDIQTTVPNVVNADANLPTNSNTADSDRGDLKADNSNLTADSK